MKKIIAVMALFAVIAAAGCSNSGTPAETSAAETATTSAKEESKPGSVTEIAYQAPDTTDEAIDFLKGKAPIFAKYIEKRTKIPHSYTATITTSDGSSYIYGFFIKDEYNFAVYSTISGTKETFVCTADCAYQFNEDSDDIYTLRRTPDVMKDIIANNLMTLNINDVRTSSFSEDTAEYEGKKYKHTLIITNGVQNHYYYDMDTEDIVYIVTPDSIMKFDFLKTEVTDESVFEIPSGLNEIDLDEYAKDIINQTNSEQTEQAAESQE